MPVINNLPADVVFDENTQVSATLFTFDVDDKGTQSLTLTFDVNPPQYAYMFYIHQNSKYSALANPLCCAAIVCMYKIKKCYATIKKICW